MEEEEEDEEEEKEANHCLGTVGGLVYLQLVQKMVCGRNSLTYTYIHTLSITGLSLSQVVC